MNKEYSLETESRNDSLAPIGSSWDSAKEAAVEYFLKLGEKYGEKVMTNVTKDSFEEGPLEAYVIHEERNEVDHVFYEPMEKVFTKQTIKYAVGTGAYFLGSVAKTDGLKIGMPSTLTSSIYLPYKPAVKGAGVLVSGTQTLIEYNGQMHDVDKMDKQIKNNSKLSSTQKNGYLKELNTVRNGYTAIAAFDIAMSCAGVFVGAALGPVGGLLFGLATGLISGLLKDVNDKTLELIDTGTSSQMNFLVDPSGYVYACVESNRISGAKVTTYWIPYDEDDDDFWDNPDESKSQVWNADEYSQLNPLYTDDHGDYAWDVPEGWWKVVAEKDGYETLTTEWLPVPPPQTEVNIGLISNTVPYVASTAVEDHVITLTFNDYMDPDTVIRFLIQRMIRIQPVRSLLKNSRLS